jgi:putative methyltransferase (TIGR04325 family)
MISMVKERVARLPLIRRAGALYYERQFVRWPGAFRGVFTSFDEAMRSAPPGSRVGYDFDELGDLYNERLFRIFPADYPVLFWLSRILSPGSRVFDFGGHVGLAYYGFESYLDYPEDFRWTVYDVPKVVEAGRRLALEHPRNSLRFSTNLGDAADHDVFHASGALQYIEKPFASQLIELGARPRHVLLNKLPLHEGASFVTLQNTMHSYNPYAVFNRTTFIASLLALGYELRDSWVDLERSCRVPFHPAQQVAAYTGLYFRLAETDAERCSKYKGPDAV